LVLIYFNKLTQSQTTRRTSPITPRAHAPRTGARSTHGRTHGQHQQQYKGISLRRTEPNRTPTTVPWAPSPEFAARKAKDQMCERRGARGRGPASRGSTNHLSSIRGRDYIRRDGPRKGRTFACSPRCRATEGAKPQECMRVDSKVRVRRGAHGRRTRKKEAGSDSRSRPSPPASRRAEIGTRSRPSLSASRQAEIGRGSREGREPWAHDFLMSARRGQ